MSSPTQSQPSSKPPGLPSAEERLSSRQPLPPPRPAYLPPSPSSTSSPLKVNQTIYTTLQTRPRKLLDSFTLPPRSGRAWTAPAGSIIRISTPEGPQVADLNVWNQHNPRERFWASRTRQLHQSHLSTFDRLWSCLPYMRPMVTFVADSLSWYGVDETGGRCHDLLGTRCDPYINVLLSGEDASYDFHCHSNLVRAVRKWGLEERDVHDVINLFQVTGLDDQGRYFMQKSPAVVGDFVELFAEQDLLLALSTCPGGDLSVWGFGEEAERRMRKVCRPLKVEVFELVDKETVWQEVGWVPAECSRYRGNHGMGIPEGEEMVVD